MHDERGRFMKGNPGGPGNPHHRKIAGLREALLRIVTPEDVEEIARRLIDVAKEGSLQAIKLFLAYVIGKPEAVNSSLDSFWPGELPWLSAGETPASRNAGEPPAPRNAGGVSPPKATPPPVPQTTAARTAAKPAVTSPTAATRVAAAVIQPDEGPLLNGGKRLTRQQRRALRRQAKGQTSGKTGNGGAAAKLNGDNGWLTTPAPTEDPLAALARQRDLLR